MYDIIIAVCIFIMGIAIGIWLSGGVLNSSAQGRPIGSRIITTTSAGDLCSRTEKESGRGKPGSEPRYLKDFQERSKRQDLE